MPIDFSPNSEPVVEGVQSARPALPHPRNAPFRLMHHPMRWDYHPEHGWLPSLRKMIIEPGVGAVDKTGDSSLAETIRVKGGWTILPWSAVPEGVPGGSYLRREPAAGGYYYCEIWETPRQLGGLPVPSKVDTDGYNRWRAWLVESGHVAPITEVAKEYAIEGVSDQARRIEARADKVPHLKEAARRKREAADKMAASAADTGGHSPRKTPTVRGK